MATPRRFVDPRYVRRIAGEIYGGTARTDPELAATLLHQHSRAGSQRGYAYQLLAAAGWRSRPPTPGASADGGYRGCREAGLV